MSDHEYAGAIITFLLAAAALYLPGLIDLFAGPSIEEHVSAALDEPDLDANRAAFDSMAKEHTR